jgi:hypothetical protein
MNPAYVPGTAPQPRRSEWQREPLLHFLVLGALLFGAARLYAPRADAEVVIDAARVERLAHLYELQTGTAPDELQRERLVESFVREEMLYREARRLELGEGDELVRRRLVQKLEYLQAEGGSAAPTDQQLKRLLAATPERYLQPARVTFEQLYFSPDLRGAEGARAAAAAARVRLDAGAPSVSSDRAPVAARIENATRDELTLAFGQRPIVGAVEYSAPGAWAGPVESGFGWHLVRVLRRTDARPLEFEQARPALLDAWHRAAQARAEAAWLDDLRSRYRVVRIDRPHLTPVADGPT